MMLPAVVLLLSFCMLLESCAGRQAIPDQNQKELHICDKYANICDNGKCIQLVSGSDWQYECECDEGFLFNQQTRKCEEAGYGQVEQPSSDNNKKESEPPSCASIGILRPCEWSKSDQQYSSSQRYNLFKTCSWKSACQPPSLGPGIAHSVSYRCVPDALITRKLVNIIFSGSALRNQNTATMKNQPAITKCTCDIKSESSFRVSAPDVRLVDAYDRCLANARLLGISESADITCSDSSDGMTLDAVETMTKETTIELSYDIPPEFIWIILRARTGEAHQQQPVPNIIVKCHPPINPPSTTRSTDKTSSSETDTTTTNTTTSTDKTETTTTTTTTTTTGITDTATNNQTHSTTPTTESTPTAPANNEGHEQSMKEQRDEEEGGVPFPAIIVPIVVILVVIVVVASIFIWRRRHRRQPDSKKPVEYESHVSPNRNQPTRAVQNKAYDDTDQQTIIQIKTANNYLADQSSDNRSGGHNYFVLEPQNLMEANPIVTETNKSAPIDQEASQNHDYFVLEPQKPQTDSSMPQDTYSSIDPDDVVIQTLPENEYNVINMTGKATTSRDPNYGTLDTVGKKGKEIEGRGEYSHIGQDANKNKEMNVYMKGKSTIDHNYGTLGTAKKGSGIEDSGDYSHIG